MNYLNNIYYIYANMDKNSKFLLTMIILIIILLLLILIVSLIINKKERKRFEENKQIIPKERNINKNINYDIEIDKKDLSPSINLNPKNIKLDSVEIKTEIDDDIEETIDEDIEVIEVIEDEKDDEIENIKKMIENTLEQEPIRLNEFEAEQEKTAIISYDELVRKAGAKKIVYKTKKSDEIIENQNEIKKNSTFKPSQIVSPIYGVQKTKEETDPVLKSFDEIENIKFRLTSTPDEEMQNDVEFLNNLKKFRSSLD